MIEAKRIFWILSQTFAQI